MTSADHLVMEALARQFKLSRQTAIMLTLLVVSPQVTPTMMMKNKIGGADHRVLVARLRAKLKKADQDFVVRNIPTMCYYLDIDVRTRLLANTGSQHEGHAV